MDITERIAAGLEAANNMLLHQGVKNPLKLLRKINPKFMQAEGFFTLEFTFWLDDNPKTRVVVSVDIKKTDTDWLPWSGYFWTLSGGLAAYAFPHEENRFQPELLPEPYDD